MHRGGLVMNLPAQVAPVQVIADEPGALMDYLAARTAETVGKRVERADVAVLATLTAVEPVPLGGPAQLARDARLRIGRLAVERALYGAQEGDELIVADPRTLGAAGTAAAPAPLVEGDRGLWLLERVREDAPYAAALPSPAYRLAPGETGPVRDASAAELAEAVAWYAGMPAEADERRDAMSEGLQHPNPRIARGAARALGDSGDPAAAQALRAAMDGTHDDQRERLAAALWRLGCRDEALAAMRAPFDGDAKEVWLQRWGLDYTVDEHGARIPELFGPDAAAAAGD